MIRKIHVDGSEMVITSGCGPEDGSSILLCHPIMDCSSMVEHRTVNAAVLGSTPSDPAIRRLSSVVERPVEAGKVLGSSPRVATNNLLSSKGRTQAFEA